MKNNYQLDFSSDKQLEVLISNKENEKKFLTNQEDVIKFLECHERKNGVVSSREISYFTSNQGKVKELQGMISGNTSLSNLSKERISIVVSGSPIDVEEDQDTYIGNAIKKANAYSSLTDNPILVEDSGFHVPSFGKHSPDVFSARYSSLYREELVNFISNHNHVLEFYNNSLDKKTKCLINKLCLIMNGIMLGFEGQTVKAQFITLATIKSHNSIFYGSGVLNGLIKIPYLQEFNNPDWLSKHYDETGYNSLFLLVERNRIRRYSNLTAYERSGVNNNHRSMAYCEALSRFLVSAASENMK